MTRVSGLQSLGDRIAGLRVERGWTQQELAERLAMSRTALSHLEAGMRTASERTVVILSGVFAVAPLELVSGTSYPLAKAERLPVIVALHTEVDLALALCVAELELAARAGDDALLAERRTYWLSRMRALHERWPDRVDRRRITSAMQRCLGADATSEVVAD
jgi:transcriptional regulator with XRE-family HTH domain